MSWKSLGQSNTPSFWAELMVRAGQDVARRSGAWIGRGEDGGIVVVPGAAKGQGAVRRAR